MHRRNCGFSALVALRRVFLSNFQIAGPIASRRGPTTLVPIPAYLFPRHLTTTSRRLRVVGGNPQKKKKSYKDVQVMADERPVDNGIPYKMVRLVNDDETLGEPRPLSDVLRGMDRTKYTLVMVAKPVEEQQKEKEEEEEGDEGDDGERGGTGSSGRVTIDPPQDAFTALMEARTRAPAAICRLMDKNARTKRVMEAKKALRQKALATKELEFNWAIDTNDMQHKLKRLGEFLGRGMRVEILIGPKRRGRMAEKAEGQHVQEKVVEVAKEHNATEIRREGQFPGVFRIIFEGRRKKP